MTSMEACYVSLLLFFFYVGLCGYHSGPLGGMISLCETPECLHGLGNVSREIGVSRKLVKFQYWVNYSFKCIPADTVSIVDIS